jgi:hypothetical protein
MVLYLHPPPTPPANMHSWRSHFSSPQMLLVWSNQEGWSWSRFACCPRQWWALYIAIQYCSVVGVANYCVGTAVYTVMLINFIEYSPSWEACNFSEDSSQCSQNLATAPCPRRWINSTQLHAVRLFYYLRLDLPSGFDRFNWNPVHIFLDVILVSIVHCLY